MLNRALVLGEQDRPEYLRVCVVCCEGRLMYAIDTCISGCATEMRVGTKKIER